jgi:hypothetical protein
MNNTASLFRKYLKSLGWIIFKSERKRRKFHNTLSKDYPELTDKVFDIIESRGGALEGNNKKVDLDKNIYNLKNSNLDFSLRLGNFMTVEINDGIFQNINLISSDYSPKNILDLGSDNGFLTNFYGKIFPDANIFGLESCKNGTLLGKELSEKLNITNCNFVNEDFFNFKSDKSFDIIISVTFIKEAINSKYGYDLNEAENEHLTMSSKSSKNNLATFANRLGSRLEDDGIIIVVERFASIFEVCRFLDGFEESTLKCDIQSSTFFEFNSVSGKEKMPLLIFKHNKAKSTLSEVQKIYSKDTPMEKDTIFDDPFYSYCLFQSFDNKKLFLEISCEYYDGSGTLYYRFYDTNTFQIMVEMSTRGYFKLNMSTHNTKDEVEMVINEIIKRHKDYCDVKVEWI